MPTVSMNVTLEAASRGDHWACFVPELGFTVYGETRADAEHEVNHALEALLGSFHGDLDAIERFLQKREVQYYDIHPDLPDGRKELPPAQQKVQSRNEHFNSSRTSEVCVEEVVID